MIPAVPRAKTSQWHQILFMVYCKETWGKQEENYGICCCHIHVMGIHWLPLLLYDEHSEQLRTHIMK